MKGLIQKMLIGGIALTGICFLLLTSSVEAKVMHTVTFMYGTKTNVQQVADGGTAIIPTDTAVNGFTFLGWTDSCYNVKSDKLILGMYVNNTPYATATNQVSSVKKINDNTSAPFLPWWDGQKGVPGVTCVVRWYNGWNNELWKTEVVPFGSSLPDPQDPCLDGFEFVGWEGSWTNITEDRAIKAHYYILHTVRFIDSVSGKIVDVQHVRDGSAAKAVTPPGAHRKAFDKYSHSFDNVTSDMDIYILYK